MVFTCEPLGLCLKLIKSKRIFTTERQAYELLDPKARALFLPLLFFCRVPNVLGSKCWRGYCMRQGQYSLRDILYKSPRQSDAQHEALLTSLLRDRDQFARSLPSSSDAGGLPVAFKSNQTVQLSLCLTCFRLLHALHRAGWVHGDSHLGNFVYAGGRLYAIDFERSFGSSDPVQHLLDIQELFGHISSVIVHLDRPHEWDMKDIPGIYFHRSVLPLLLLFCG